jgi:hypothetical protein
VSIWVRFLLLFSGIGKKLWIDIAFSSQQGYNTITVAIPFLIYILYVQVWRIVRKYSTQIPKDITFYADNLSQGVSTLLSILDTIAGIVLRG